MFQRGDMLAKRYRLAHPRKSYLDASCWTARDQILDRVVDVTIVTAEQAEKNNTSVLQIVDAARRSALVTHPSIIKIIDVISDHEQQACYIVTESLPGLSLAELCIEDPLSPAQARAVIAEAAQGLEVARSRGLHHLLLHPQAIRVDGHGKVYTLGIGYTAEIMGISAGSDVEQTTADTVGLVSLLYFALTTHWPGISDTELLAAEYTGDGEIRSPSEYDSAIGGDLAGICTRTLGTADDGPQSPGELVTELKPWPPVAPFGGTLDSSKKVETISDTTAPEGDSQPIRTSYRVAGSATGVGASLPGTPPPAAPGAPIVTGRQSAAPPVQFAPVQVTTSSAAANTAKTTSAAPNTGPTWPTAATSTATSRSGAGSGAGAAASGHALNIDFGRIFLIGVVLLVIFGVFWAYRAFTSPIGPGTAATNQEEPETPVVAEKEEPVPDEEPEEEPEPEPEYGPPVIAGASTVDPPPQGDNGERPENAPLAIDGDPSTFWFSRWYASPDFRIKDGIGFVITLEEETEVSRITMNVGGDGGNVQVRATDAEHPTSGDVLVEGPMSPDTVLELPEPTVTKDLVLWINQLPVAHDDGRNKVVLYEVTVE